MNTPVTIGGIVGPYSAPACAGASLAEQPLRRNIAETRLFAVETTAERVAAVATLVNDAVATFDADPGASRRYLLGASALLRACTAHESEKSRQARSRRGLANWQLTRILDYIERHLAARITGEDLASLIGVSIGQMFRNFKVSVGMPPLQYVESLRLELVCLLLRTTQETLCQIAVTAGFYDHSHLCRVFRRALGVTPSAWRRENAFGPGRRSPERPRCEVHGPQAHDASRS